MPTRAVFRCQFCDAVPDHGTQRSLAGQVSERMFGEYLDAFPGRWLVWNGGGPLGPRRYACREHRGDLVAYLRYHYATVAAQVWKMPPYPARWPDEKRPHMGGSMGIIKFGLRGGLLQDRPSGDVGGDPASAGPSEVPGLPAGDEDSGRPAGGDRTSEADPTPGTSPGSEAEPDAGPAPEDNVAGMPGKAATPPDDLVPPDELLVPDEWYPSDGLFPPGELFLPTDGRFAPGGSASGEDSERSGNEGDDPAWPPLDGPPEDDDGPWPTAPGSPPA